MELPIIKYTGESTNKKADLDDSVFKIESKDHAIYLDIKHYMANKRQGTHKTKEKGEIKGSTRKLRKQKGSGNARVGSIKSPIFRGGGRIFGPKPRDYGFKVNKKIKKLARKSALSYKAKGNNITILEKFSFESPKTKEYIKMLKDLSLEGNKTLFVFDKADRNLVLSGRNVLKTKITTADKLNTYDIVDASKLVLSEDAIKILEQKLA